MLARFPALLLVATSAAAQFIHQEYHTRNFTVAKSPGNQNITISYKEPRGVCKTAFPSQKQYTGWVSVPGDYPTNLFFWFVEAREKTDKLTIWLNGGPGSSSMYGFFTGNGPCSVVERGLDQYDTVAREWGWDRGSNMIFIDQPNQVGFSYDVPSNGTMLFPNGTTVVPAFSEESTKNSWAIANGTFSSTEQNATVNTTKQAAYAVWHMLQGFLTTFPQYLPPAPKPVSVNLFAESYGGRYGPIFADIWEQQNKIQNTPFNANSTRQVNLASLGIVNGCVDQEIQLALSPKFATANTYGFKAYSDKSAKYYTDRFNSSGGCAEWLRRCASLSASLDPNDSGIQDGVNSVCRRANHICDDDVDRDYFAAGRSAYDISAPLADPFPSYAFVDYLNQASTLSAIGSPINYTMNSNAVYLTFDATGDFARGNTIPLLAGLLNKGIRVGLIYGDRDYICHWFGGEAVSLEVAKAAGGQYLSQFPAAGYSPIIVNSSYIGGEVRQFGNLSFSRVYQSGHSVPAYQPETAFQIFFRVSEGNSISTGQEVNLDTYSTSGPANSTTKHKLPGMTDTVCYVRAFQDSCDAAAQELAASGNGVVINGILYSSSADWPLMSATSTSTKPASKTKTATLTGAFTATRTPKSKDSASTSNAPPPAFKIFVLFCAALLPMIDWI